MIETRKTYHLSHHRLCVEEFKHGILCNGIAFLWRRKHLFVYTGPRCWGHTVSVPAGSYTSTFGCSSRDPEYSEEPRQYVLDDPGMYLSVIRVLQTDPLQLECIEYVVLEEGDDPVPLSPEKELLCRTEDGGVCIDGCREDLETILIPAAIGGQPVVRLDLGKDALTGNCRALIISEGVQEVSLDLENARRLSRLEFPASARLISSPRGISGTNWFRRRNNEPVYLGGYYCGTPGGGCGGKTELVIADGTVAVAEGADFHCYWHRIVMPDSVRTIGRCAFSDARCLEELRLPAAVQEVGDSAFQYCPRLKNSSPPPSISHPPRRWGHQSALGPLCAYPAVGPIFAAGRSYPNIGAVTARQKANGLFCDRYGNTVQKITVENPNRNGDRSEIEEVFYWYLRGPEGLTEILFDEVCQVYFVRDGLSECDLPPVLLEQLADPSWKTAEEVL